MIDPRPDLPPPPGPGAPLQLPLYWSLISEADRRLYHMMREAISSSAWRHRRNRANLVNCDILQTIKGYVVRNDPDDWRRALVCGISWFESGIAINVRQLRLLLSKCKSSINAMFAGLGYVAVPTTSEHASEFSARFPIIKENFAELRQWTIRELKVSAGEILAAIPEIESAAAEALEPTGPSEV
jgi:hypothetical protein